MESKDSGIDFLGLLQLAHKLLTQTIFGAFSNDAKFNILGPRVLIFNYSRFSEFGILVLPYVVKCKVIDVVHCNVNQVMADFSDIPLCTSFQVFSYICFA